MSLVGLSLASADDRRQNRDALLALANEATHRAPRLKARDARRGRALTRDETDVVPGILVEPRHGLEQRGELVAVAFIEKRRKRVEGVGRDLLECVGGHGVLQWTGCPWFLRALRNPTTRLEDTRLCHRRAEHRGDSHRACQRSVLARREAAGERCGVIVRSTTACRWRSHLADDKRMTDTFGSTVRSFTPEER